MRRYNGLSGADEGAGNAVVDSGGYVIVSGYTDEGVTGSDILIIKYTSDGVPLWTNRYNGPANKDDGASAIALDANDNVYVAGTEGNNSSSGGSETTPDYVTIKYSSAGVPLWTNRYDGPANARDTISAIAVAASGEVYVTGSSYGIGTGVDWATIAYSSAGVPLWTNRWAAPINTTDSAYFIAVDSGGGVYVVGMGYGYFTTVKYSNTGEELWVRQDAGRGTAYGIATDATGNVYVTGEVTDTSTWTTDFATVKYSSAGDQLWVQRYNGPGNSHDYPRRIALDAGGNVYVTGQSTGSGTDYDFATIKYSSTGQQLWVQRYNGPGNGYESVVGLAVDASGNVYVNGRSAGSGTGSDCATVKYSSTGTQLWVKRYNGPGNGADRGGDIALDAGGNLYATVASYGGDSGIDAALFKYSSAGELLWSSFYYGPGNCGDAATAVALDAGGNVVVAGFSARARTAPYNNDYSVVKYSSAGLPLWTNRYNGPGNDDDRASCVAVDTNGKVYVTGRSQGSGTGFDYATLAYSAAGAPLWTNRYNSLANGNDEAKALALDPAGNLVVTVPSATIKYSPAGDLLWNTYTGGDALAVDRDGNAIVTASGTTIKFSSAGVPLWTAAGGSAAAVDTGGNVFVTGYVIGSGTAEDYVTSAYSSAGVPLWVHHYNGPGNRNDRPQAIAVDASGDVYVTGWSVGTGGIYDSDYATIKYSGAGVPLWTNRYSAPANDVDWPVAIAVDARGNVVVTGSSASSNVDPYNYDYLTIAYSSAGAQLWVKRHNGPANGDDEPETRFCLALGPNGEVYVTGTSDGSYPSWGYASGYIPDFATVKYVMALPPLIVVSPTDRTNASGTTASFNVTASGTQPLSYQWRKNGTNLLDGGNASGVTTTNLLLANVQSGDAGDYNVVVANAHGSVTSAVARLTVMGGQSIPPHIQGYRFTTGQFAFDLDGDPGCRLLIQASTDLKHWVTLRGCQLTNSPLGFVDPESHLYPKRFYRLMDAAGLALMEQQRWQSGQFHLNLVGEPGRTVVVEASTNLADWTPIATNVLGTDPTPFTDPQSAQYPRRFYRLFKP